MRTLIVMLGASMFSSAFGDTITCGYNPIPVTPGLICGTAYSLAFNFGMNPLPDGGQLDLNSVDVVSGYNDEFSFDLNFSFPHPAQGTTVLEFTACCDAYFGLSLEAQGSDFSITEAFPGSNLPDLNLNASGTVTLGCVFGQQCFDQPPLADPSLFVVTTITDYAGDLSGFQETFIAPEPNSWEFLAGGLLCMSALLRLRSWITMRTNLRPMK
jgi:hypothetical protein